MAAATFLSYQIPSLLNSSPKLCSHSSTKCPRFFATKSRTVLVYLFKDSNSNSSKNTNRLSVNGGIKAAPGIPARDRVIDFGKYKGKMLGTLPSTYLRWVSKNLRARDFEEWANLADQVLVDPIYQDRLEWEFAEKVLNGDVLSTFSSSLSSLSSSSAVSALLEISNRFGWDNEDKVGWSQVKFDLLGTSKGGRIPRISLEESLRKIKRQEKEAAARRVVGRGDEDARERRDERRERLKLRRNNRNPISMRTRTDMLETSEERLANNPMWMDMDSKDREADVYNPFPGRESLFKKVLTSKHRRSTF